MADQFDLIKKCILEFETEKIGDYVKKALKSGATPVEIIEKGIRPGAELAGEKFDKGEFYLPELVMAGEAIKQGISVLEPLLMKDEKGYKGTVITATVQGDLHDIGKDLVSVMLKGNGFKVIDLGVDVPPEKVVKAVKENDAKVVCLSILLTPAYEGLSATLKALKDSSLREKVKVVLGGAAVSPDTVKRYGADYYGHDANQAVEICNQILAK
ncbi:MAG: corrinoid protein [Candidatus Freyarchaeota archaeon]|nr:corrinoid protein [Candidatus Jordarchaeia archaeon]MBS7269398.1 corrinoid protein [Candidatus Jordarchaeia archaeon]MBS7280186.1 corrinoid protein [Candidatus Jordarchaeia archaeon]